MNKRRLATFLLGGGLTLLLMALLPNLVTSPSTALADDHTSEPQLVDEQVEITGDNSYCLLCHGDTSQTLTLEDGRVLDLHVGGDTIANSVHGDDALGCVDCHGDNKFPHVEPLPTSGRVYTVAAAQSCTACHTEQNEALAPSVHHQGLVDGNYRAATCVDCHGAHDVKSIQDQPEIAANICGDCHVSVFDEYEDSIHGQALLERGDTNAPTCTYCHGVHGINQPTTAQARNRSPELCAECHADEDLMEQYDISTNVFDSYIADFHGTTVALFNQQDPNVATNKAVCVDCHGVHNITPADDSKSQVAKENLLVTCQQCHPNATSDFPDSWVGHFEPTAEEHPLLFGVEWFYRLLIPAVLGGFGVMVVSDVFGRLRRAMSGKE